MARLNLSPDMVIESSGSRKQYKLLEALGEGTFGQVWLTSDNQSRDLRAVKVIAGSDISSILPEVQQLQAALNAAGRAYVPDFYEASLGCVARHGGRSEFLMIVMEFIDGVNAWTLSKGTEMPEYCARVVLANTCRALGRLHACNIVHRDIKGANVLVSPEGEVKLCDFGISTLLSNKRDLQQPAGTAAYMAPEICALGSGSDEYDEKVDVWALGILAIDLAMGFIPGDGRRDQLRMIYTCTRNVPDVLRPSGFSVEYQHMAKSCLERDSRTRPSASEVLSFKCLHTPASDVMDFQEWVPAAIQYCRQ